MYKIYDYKEKKFVRRGGWTNSTYYFNTPEKAEEFITKLCRGNPEAKNQYKIMKSRWI